MQFWILDVWDASDGRTQSAWESVSLSSASAAKSAKKFQEISRNFKKKFRKPPLADRKKLSPDRE
jgi:hypothetical protein